MNNKYKLTIIIPVYNVAGYIIDCLKSVVTQSTDYPFECILIDDCGSDNSIELAKQFVNAYSGKIHFRIIRHDRNKGLSAARNTGIDAAKADYVFFLDSDDMLYPDTIYDLLSVLQKHPGVDMVQSCMVWGGDESMNYDRSSFPEYTENASWIRKSLCIFKIPDAACNRLIRLDFIKENKLYFKEGLYQEDTIWSYTLSTAIKSIAFNFTPTYYYRVNPSSIMQSLNYEREAIQFSKVINYVYCELLNCNKIKWYNVFYLTRLASNRVLYNYKEKGYSMLAFKQNPLFRIVLSSNLHALKNRNKCVLYRLPNRLCEYIFCHILCFKTIFSYKKSSLKDLLAI